MGARRGSLELRGLCLVELRQRSAQQSSKAAVENADGSSAEPELRYQFEMGGVGGNPNTPKAMAAE